MRNAAEVRGRGGIAAAIALSLLVLVPASVAIASPQPFPGGEVDGGFLATIPTAGHPAEARFAAYQDGKILVVGSEGGSLLLARFASNGYLDQTFRPGRWKVTEVGPLVPQDMLASGVGGIIVVGTTGTATAVAKFSDSGEIDLGFGVNGVATLPGPARQHGSIAKQWDQSLLVMPGLERLSPTGQYLGAPSPADPPPDAPTVMPGVVYYASDGPQARFSDGARNPVFATPSGLPGTPVAVGYHTWSGRVYVAGTIPTGPSTSDLFVRAYRPDGQLETAFGNGGTATIDIGPVDTATDMIVEYNRIVVVGDTQDGAARQLAVASLTSDGRLDRAYANGGVMVSPALSRTGRLSVDVTTADSFLVAGTTPSGAAATVRIWMSYGPYRFAQGWGWNGIGQLGDTTDIDRHEPTEVLSFGLLHPVAAGSFHSVATKDDATVVAWGWNGYGQLGDGTTTTRLAPTPVPGLEGVVATAAGAYHSLALRNDLTVWAWGWNGLGQLGDGTTTDRLVPTPVKGLDNVVAIAAGAYHNLALNADGTVWAWGWNGYGALGDGTRVERHEPVPVASLTGVGAISAGAFHSLALTTDGRVSSWGWNGIGQLGRPTDGADAVPTAGFVPMDGLPKVVDISGGGLHSLAVLEDGRVVAFGWNGYGQLGTGGPAYEFGPVVVPGLTAVASVAAGTYHSLAVKRDGTVLGWGWNYFGQVGDGTTTDRTRPVVAAGLSSGRGIAAGGVHSLAL